jgi:hypothetical protein
VKYPNWVYAAFHSSESRSWQRVAQAETFDSLRICIILQSQQFFMALTRNIGPEEGYSGVETFVRNIYLDGASGPVNNLRRS